MTSNSRRQSWRDVMLVDTARNDTANAAKPSFSEEFGAILRSADAVFLSQSSAESDLSFVHHLTKLEKKDKAVCYVALVGISSKATPVELDMKECFEKIELRGPTWDDLIKHPEKERENNSQMTNYSVCKLLSLPPSLKEPLLNSEDKSPHGLLSVAAKILRDKKTGTSGETVDVDTCQNLLAFLWATGIGPHSEGKTIQMEIKESSNPEVLQWSDQLHDQHICEKFNQVLGKSGGSSRKQRTWEESFEKLAEYMKEYGDCNCPREFKSDPALGEWVKNQRATRKTLSDERRSKLESIGFTFCNTQLDRSNKIWEAYYEQLKAYVDQNGNCRPSKRETKSDRALQHWISMQRQSYKRGVLLDDRKAKLDKLGFIWQLKASYKARSAKDETTWQSMYDKLVDFHKSHAHINVPKRPKTNRPLWEFLYAQRKAYNEDRLPPERAKLLEQLGLVWERDNGQELRNSQWNAKYIEAKAFRELHGHLEVPRTGKWGNANLLKWLARQREHYKTRSYRPVASNCCVIWTLDSKATQRSGSKN